MPARKVVSSQCSNLIFLRLSARCFQPPELAGQHPLFLSGKICQTNLCSSSLAFSTYFTMAKSADKKTDKKVDKKVDKKAVAGANSKKASATKPTITQKPISSKEILEKAKVSRRGP